MTKAPFPPHRNRCLSAFSETNGLSNYLIGESLDDDLPDLMSVGFALDLNGTKLSSEDFSIDLVNFEHNKVKVRFLRVAARKIGD